MTVVGPLVPGLLAGLAGPLLLLSRPARAHGRGTARTLLLALSWSGWCSVAVGVASTVGEGGLGLGFALLLGAFAYIELCLLLRRGGRSLRAQAETGRGARESPPEEDSPPAHDAPPEEEAEGELPPEALEIQARIEACERIPVDHVMVAREAIVWVDAATPLGETLERMRARARARLLVAVGTLDRVLGVAHAKDILPLTIDGQGDAPVRSHVRRALLVPQGRSLARVLDDFRRARVHIGVVTDAKGRTVGLVTQRDIFRYLAGTA